MIRKTILVSGATRGIGRAIAEKFHNEGFNIAVCARNSSDLDLLKNEFDSKKPEQKTLALSCDMASKQDIIQFARTVIEAFGEIHVLVNNAGIFLPGQVGNEEDGVFEKLWNTNIGGPYHLTRAILPYLPIKKGAHIFNICSTASITPYINGGSYCISKHALLGMSRVLREELKEKAIKVTAILPGATYTDSWAGSGLPEDRFISADEIAGMVWNCYNMSYRTVVEELLIRPQAGDIS
jgi:short-subunit dehydrogenase